MRRGRLGKRRFAVMNLVQGEVLLLKKDDLQRMISDFPVPFKKLFHLSVQHLSKLISRNISSVVKHKSFPDKEFAKGSNDASQNWIEGSDLAESETPLPWYVKKPSAPTVSETKP